MSKNRNCVVKRDSLVPSARRAQGAVTHRVAGTANVKDLAIVGERASAHATKVTSENEYVRLVRTQSCPLDLTKLLSPGSAQNARPFTTIVEVLSRPHATSAMLLAQRVVLDRDKKTAQSVLLVLIWPSPRGALTWTNVYPAPQTAPTQEFTVSIPMAASSVASVTRHATLMMGALDLAQ